MTSYRKWNWQQSDWPNFTYNPKVYEDMERAYLHNRGVSLGVMKHFSQDDLDKITIETRVAFKRVGVITLNPLSTTVFRIMWSL